MELTQAVKVILTDLKKGIKTKPNDHQEMAVADYREAVYLIKKMGYADGVVSEKAGIGNQIQFANLENATITLRGIDYLESY